MDFKRTVTKGPLPYMYMKLSLEFAETVSLDITEVQLKTVILEALKSLHGEIAQAITVDILRYTEATKEAIVRVPHSGFVKLWSALTLFGQCGDVDCAFRVHQVSGHLIALATDSRQIHSL